MRDELKEKVGIIETDLVLGRLSTFDARDEIMQLIDDYCDNKVKEKFNNILQDNYYDDGDAYACCKGYLQRQIKIDEILNDFESWSHSIDAKTGVRIDTQIQPQLAKDQLYELMLGVIGEYAEPKISIGRVVAFSEKDKYQNLLKTEQRARLYEVFRK